MNSLIAFYSRTGNVARLAEAVAEGARQIDGTEVRPRRVDDLAPEEPTFAKSGRHVMPPGEGHGRTAASIESRRTETTGDVT